MKSVLKRLFSSRIFDYLRTDVLFVLPLALLAAPLTKQLVESDVAAAYVVTICECVGFYLGLLILDYRRRSGAPRQRLKTVVKGLLAEFTIPEVADLLVLRPVIIYGCVAVAEYLEFSKETGLIGGGYVADVAFYTLASVTNKLRHRR